MKNIDNNFKPTDKMNYLNMINIALKNSEIRDYDFIKNIKKFVDPSVYFKP
jgi:hypothetical protein